MSLYSKDILARAIALPGFEDWSSPVDVPNLNRPPVRPHELPGQGRVAAVLLLLYPLSETNFSGSGSQLEGSLDLNLVLTKRNAGLSSHAGQISFPGGTREPTETLWQTACRETFEEIGVGGGADAQSNQIELIGQLRPVYIPPSDFTVSPFVGWQDSAPQFICAPEEVEAVIETSLSHLLQPRTLKMGEVVSASSKRINVPFYEVQGHRVWGATAIMLSELIERIRRVLVK